MTPSIRIQHLQWTVGAVAAFGCIALGGSMVMASWADLRRADQAAAYATRFSVVMKSGDLISGERGPANSAMDPNSGRTEELTAALKTYRLETDRRLAQVASLQGAGTESLRGAVASVSRRLAEARAKVDAICAEPPEQRTGAQIAGAINAMFAVTDEIALVRNEQGRQLIAAAPQVGAEILLQTEASAFREQAGRLGSYAVMSLTGGLTSDEGREAFAHTADRVRQFWYRLDTFGRAFADEEVTHALKEVETAYFGRSWPLARDTVDGPDLRGLSAADFTRRYVPGLAAPTRLKDSLGALTWRKIEQERQSAIAATVLSASLTTAVVMVLAALGLICRNRLFLPLIAVREEVLALAHGSLSEPRRTMGWGREVDEMFTGLAILRRELQRKRLLERAQQRMTRRLKTLSETDALTGLMNRRALAERAAAIVGEADRKGLPISVILVDIDHFKAVNDVHGHAVGDHVLRRVSGVLKALAGYDDIVARYGGEEFLVLAPGRDEDAAMTLAEQMRRGLATRPPDRAVGISVTASFGVAARSAGADFTWEMLVAQADANLYRAKRLGRNRVCGEIPDEPDALSA